MTRPGLGLLWLVKPKFEPADCCVLRPVHSPELFLVVGIAAGAESMRHLWEKLIVIRYATRGDDLICMRLQFWCESNVIFRRKNLRWHRDFINFLLGKPCWMPSRYCVN